MLVLVGKRNLPEAGARADVAPASGPAWGWPEGTAPEDSGRQSGPLHAEAGLSGPNLREAGLSAPLRPEAGLSAPHHPLSAPAPPREGSVGIALGIYYWGTSPIRSIHTPWISISP